MQKTITNKLVSTETGYSKNQVNYMKNNYPRALELMKKGLLLEVVEKLPLLNEDCVTAICDIQDGSLQEKYFRKPRIS